MIASLSSLTNAKIAATRASRRVTCSLRLAFSETEQVTESGVAAMALPSAATLVFVLPFPASLASSVFVLITPAQELGVETSLPCLRNDQLNFKYNIFPKVLSPTYRDDPASLALFSFAFITASAFFFAWRK